MICGRNYFDQLFYYNLILYYHECCRFVLYHNVFFDGVLIGIVSNSMALLSKRPNCAFTSRCKYLPKYFRGSLKQWRLEGCLSTGTIISRPIWSSQEIISWSKKKSPINWNIFFLLFFQIIQKIKDVCLPTFKDFQCVYHLVPVLLA